MAGFYKRNQGQLTRTISAIGMALVVAGICWFVYDLMIFLFPDTGQESTVTAEVISPGEYELSAGWPERDQRYGPGTLIDSQIKDEMIAYDAQRPADQAPSRIQVRSLAGVGYARWVQVGVPAALFIVGAVFILYLVNKPKFADFLIATEGEMKKVSWSSRSELIGSTTIVILTVAVLGIFIAIADLIITVVMSAINVH